jgi:hypothetical protein
LQDAVTMDPERFYISTKIHNDLDFYVPKKNESRFCKTS